MLATNIAETSITIPGIRFVVDCGYVKQRVFFPNSGFETLEKTIISKASAQQRTGRAGREAKVPFLSFIFLSKLFPLNCIIKKGTCYRLYTEDDFWSQFPQFTTPEILRSNLATVILQMKSMVFICHSFHALSPKFLIIQKKRELKTL